MYHQDYSTGYKIAPEKLKQRGYRLTARFVTVSDRYKVYELLPVDDSGNEPEKCLLVRDIRFGGVTIRGSFQQHNRTGSVSHVAPSMVLKSHTFRKFETLPREEAPSGQERGNPRIQNIYSPDPRHFIVDV